MRLRVLQEPGPAAPVRADELQGVSKVPGFLGVGGRCGQKPARGTPGRVRQGEAGADGAHETFEAPLLDRLADHERMLRPEEDSEILRRDFQVRGSVTFLRLLAWRPDDSFRSAPPSPRRSSRSAGSLGWWARRATARGRKGCSGACRAWAERRIPTWRGSWT